MVYHKPVMLAESVQGLNIQPEGRYVDVTFGGGGHSGEILSQLSSGHLYAFDQDADARANGYADPKFTLIPSNFRFLRDRLEELKATPVDGLLADLGVSSHQFDEASRGFSIRFDADLDMRMDQEAELSAKEVLNTYPEEELARVFKYYGELPQAKRMARAIVAARAEQPIHTVAQLKQLLAPFTPKAKENTFYAVVFQALRIEVNKELEVLQELLLQSMEVLKPGGRLVVISYHSLEDRLVKNIMRSGKFEGDVEKDFYGNKLTPFELITRKPIVPTEEENEKNSRARSAKLRIAEKN